MPRHLVRRISASEQFSMLILKMTSFRKFDLVQLFFDSDCTPIESTEFDTLVMTIDNDHSIFERE